MIRTAQPAYRALRNKLLISCATAAIATVAVTPQKAHAQVAGAFRGSITGTTGVVSRDQTSGTTETINIGSPTATIDWNPLGEINTDGNMVFLPAGNVATFQGDANAGDYTVLNRILPDGAVAIQLDGTVNSLVDGGATGGKIWFYSPNGLVIGSTAVFDVGGLLLTTLEPTSLDPGSNSFFATFGNAINPNAKISIADTAKINALANNSYVALIAPRIEQGGTVQVNGSAAYVAGEAVTMTMNQGLFDISVDIGTDDGNGVVHTGSTTGPANQAAGDNHRIYMVAVPKNTALTMLLGGTVGFGDAASAEVQNGAIYISSGAHVFEGDNGPVFVPADAPLGNIEIGAGTYTSSVTGYATGDASALAAAGSASFTQDLALQSVNGQAMLLASGTGNVLSVGGNATLWANRFGAGGHAVVNGNSGGTVHIFGDLSLHANGSMNDSQGATGGVIDVTADNGFVTVDGRLEADAVAFLSGPNSDGFSYDGQGGTINFHSLNGGEIKAGSLLANASAWGGSTNGGGLGTGGNAFGGSIIVNAELGGKLTVSGSAQANADAYGGDVFGTGTQAGSGTGGWVAFLAHGGTISLGSASLSADGSGGEVASSSGGGGGEGRGGGVRLETEDANSAIQITGDIFANSNGHGSSGTFGGSGYGGNAGLDAYGGSMEIGGTINLNAVATGGNADLGFGGAGGYAEGGIAYVQAEAANAPSSLISAGDVTLDVQAYGGTGGAGDGVQILAGTGGDAQGGLYETPPPNTPATGGAFVLADAAGGALQLGNVSLYAAGHGGNGGAGGNGQNGGAGGNAFGGTAQAGSFNPSGGTATTGSASFAALVLDGSAWGGDGGAGGAGGGQGDGGSATGGGSIPCGDGFFCGGAVLNAKGSVTVAGNVWMGAQAWGGDGGFGGSALGGGTWVETYANSLLSAGGDLESSAAAWGGYGSVGSGGGATGGQAVAIADADSEFDVFGRLFLDTAGNGGSTGVAGTSGGAGTGGESYLGVAAGGSLTANEAIAWSAGTGGSGLAQGGNGTGGTATIDVEGLLDADIVRAQAFGYGGESSGGAGGTATGGEAAVNAALGATLTFGTELIVDAPGFGGDGVSGGSASGGSSTLTVDGGVADGTGTVIVASRAEGGDATGSESTGGAATGGTNLISILNGGDISTAGFVNLDAAAFGGDSPWQGGTAGGGSSSITINGGSMSAGSIGDYANAWGGDGLFGGDGTGGTADLSFGELGGSLDVVAAGGVEAIGFGGAGVANAAGTGGTGGAGSGGTASFNLSALATADFGTDPTYGYGIYVDAYGEGGAGGSGATGGAGGAGSAGTASFNVDGVLSTVGESGAYAQGNGGAGGQGTVLGGAGGAGFGGVTTVTVAGEATGGPLTSWARGNGGAGGAGPTSGDGGSAQGGTSDLTVTGQALVDGILVNTSAFGGAGANGGGALGGQSTANLNGTVTTTNSVQVTSQGFGGAGDNGSGGDGTGGSPELYVNGTVHAGWVFMGNGGFGGNGVTAGGIGTGGNSYAFIGGPMIVDTTFSMESWATGGSASVGLGGSAQGGTALLEGGELGNLSAADLTLTGAATGGNGGDGASGGDGGSATAGTALVDTGVAPFTVSGTLTVSADATGGQGGNGTTGAGGNGGSATAGEMAWVNIGGDTNASSILASAQATGGNGGSGTIDGAGGDAFGGHGSVDVFDGASLTSATAVNILAGAVGGSGANGGNALGGTTGFGIYGTGTASLNNVALDSSGAGGAGLSGAGGNGQSNLAIMLIEGTVTSANIDINAAAVGGAGTTGAGGNADAGTATLNIPGALDAGNVRVASEAYGGDGATGGNATGGSASLVLQGSLTAPQVWVSSDVAAGDGSSGNGGEARGGDADFTIDGGSADVSGLLHVSAWANFDVDQDGIPEGGNGAVDGGDAYGGSALIRILATGGSLTVAGDTDIVAGANAGFGGANGGGTGGTGGDGHGGTAEFIVDPTSQVTSVSLQALGLIGNGWGGNGGNSTVGGLGGTGFGGTTSLSIGGGSFSAGDILSFVRGQGGNGGTGSAGAGGDAGLGQGGTNSFSLASGATFNAAGTYLGNANGFGGDGGTGTTVSGNGGNAQSGTNTGTIDGIASVGGTSVAGFVMTSFAWAGNGQNGGSATAGSSTITINGSLTAVGTLQASASARGGDGTDNGGSADAGSASIVVRGDASSGGLNVVTDAQGGNGGATGGSADAGNASLTIDFGSGDFADALVSADAIGGTGASQGVATAGSVSVGSYNGGSLTGSLLETATGDLGTGSVLIATSGCDCGPGTIDLANLTLLSSSDLNDPLGGSDITVSGLLQLESDGNISFTDVTAGSFEFSAGGAVNGGNVSVSDYVDGEADGAVTLGNITAGPGLPTNEEGYSVVIKSGTSINVGDVSGAGSVGFATVGNLVAGNVASGDVLLALVSGDMSFGSITTPSTGRVYLADASMFIDNGGLDDTFDPAVVLALQPVASGGSIALGGPVTTGMVQAAAGTTFTAGDITASQLVDVLAGGLADFQGVVSAPTITVTSGDLNVGANGSLGVLGLTDLLTLNAASDQPVIIGDQGAAPAPGQYQLWEFGGIVADNMVINAIGVNGGPAPDMQINDVGYGGYGTGGPVSTISFNTDGSIYVLGALDYNNAAAGDTLSLSAGDKIEVVTDAGGSISMTDSTGALAGTLNLTAHDVWVADQAILDQLEADPNFAGRNDALFANSGTDNQAGSLQAGGILVDLLGSSLMVQNSGTTDSPAGISVGDGGLTIVNEGAEPATVVLFGRAVSGGTTTGGDDFAEAVQTTGTFTGDSVLNGCPVGGCAA
ncbi:MAG TPA: hypothetical protein VFK28_03410, partial [Sphingomicrobium sp.]|nr:hypothetical protein [Sphingomicrobium sp.]